MIAQLTGRVIHSSPPQMVLEVAGIGYEVLCPLNTFYQLDTEKHTIYTQLIVKEDAHTLYGFNSLDEKLIFNELMRASGVGAKVALAILSTLSIRDVVDCISSGDYILLQQTPGIGKKTAQKIIVELKDRLPKLPLSGRVQVMSTQQNIGNQVALDKALSALVSLNFKEKEAQTMLVGVDRSLSAEEMIKLALIRK